MDYIFLGYERFQGTFQDNDYNTYKLQFGFTKGSSRPWAERNGYFCVELKVSAKKLEKIFCTSEVSKFLDSKIMKACTVEFELSSLNPTLSNIAFAK